MEGGGGFIMKIIGEGRSAGWNRVGEKSIVE
jgi:hypothetical protein